MGNYLFNRPMSGDVEEDARFKLVPTPEDRATFKDIIEGGWKAVRSALPAIFYQNGNMKTGQAPKAVLAFSFFVERIQR